MNTPAPPVTRMTLTYPQLRAANLERCKKWHPGGVSDWSLSDWVTATTGELGEAANIVKKLNRCRDGLKGNKETEAELRAALAHEIADTAIYLDLLAAAAGVDLGQAIIEKFNIVSERNGFPDRLSHTQAETTHRCVNCKREWREDQLQVGPTMERIKCPAENCYSTCVRMDEPAQAETAGALEDTAEYKLQHALCHALDDSSEAAGGDVLITMAHYTKLCTLNAPFAEWHDKAGERGPPPIESLSPARAAMPAPDTLSAVDHIRVHTSDKDILFWCDQIEAQLEARAAMPGRSLTDAVAAFLMKYDKIEPAMIDAFKHQFIHGMRYEGENWGKELDAMRLAASETLQGDTAHHAEATNLTAPDGTGVGLRSLPPVGPPRPALTDAETLHFSRVKSANAESVQPSSAIEFLCGLVERLLGKVA